jgi:YHS domain-containing protein
MKRLIIISFILVFGFGYALQVNAQDKESKQVKNENVKQANNHDAKPVAKEVKTGKPFNTVCPVSSEEIDDPVLVEYNGKVYGVCCKSCLKKFKNDPEKYISRLSSDGKKLVKK